MANENRQHAFTRPTPGVPEPYRQLVEQALQRFARLIAANTTADAALSNRVTELEDSPPDGVTDHGALTGLGDDDHTQYALAGSATTSRLTQNTSRLLGRTTASSGAIEEITVGSGLSLSAGALTNTAGSSQEQVEDWVAGLLVAGNGIDLTYVDGSGTLTVDVDESELAMQAPQYVTLATSTALPNERVLTPGHGLDLVDAGAGSTVTLDVDETELDGELLLRWTTVRTIDFASWAATDFSGDADGTTHSLDGGDGALTWTTQNAANANSASGSAGFFRRNNSDSGDDSGNGLRISHDQSVSTSIIRATQTGPRLTVPLNTLIPNFSPFIEYRFELQINRFLDVNTAPTNLTATMAVYQAAGTPTGSSARFAGVGFTRNGASNGAPTIIAGNNTRLPVTASTHTYATGTSFAHNVVGMVLSPSNVAAGYSADYASGWPADTACRAIGSTSEAFPNSATSPLLDENCVLEIGVGSNASATGTVDVMFRRLRVLRRIR
jgi:hypothetical protein